MEPPRPQPSPDESAGGLSGTEWQAFVDAVYQELRRLAQRHMEREPQGHTLQATALVHEAYLKLSTAEGSWESRAHFYNAAGTAMRRILVDHARRRQSDKRGGQVERVPIELAEGAFTEDVDLVLLDLALEQLDRMDPRAHQIVHLRFFVGLHVEEIAKLLDVSPRSVKREWSAARLWLFDWIRKHEADHGKADHGP